MTGVYIFLFFLTLLFVANTAIHLPLASPVDLARTGPAGLQAQRGVWYVLEPESYSAGPQLGSISMSSSFIPFYTSEYTYYCVTVHSDETGAFSMPVRVRGEKRKLLENGGAVKLYGMASELTGELRTQMDSAADRAAQTQYICLNDNGDTPVKRYASAAVFAILACFCVFLMAKLAGKRTA